MNFRRLKEDLFLEVPYPEHLTKLIGNAEPWRAFCTLSTDKKNCFTFPDHEKTEDTGYRLRSQAGGRDNKEYFHISEKTDELVNLYGLSLSDPKEKAFIEYGIKVHRKAEKFAFEIGLEMEKELPELARLIKENRCGSHLRLLHYTPTNKEEILAAQHYDRSLFTLHLYESAPGLQFLNWDMEWKDAPMKKGSTVIFNGYRMEKLTNGKIQKTWHRVANEGKKERFSMVLFVWSHDVPSYPYEARSQNETPQYVHV